MPRKPTQRMLARSVAALPVREWLPLKEAFAMALRALGSDELSARELTAHARAGRIELATRELRPDGSERHLILASEFWNVSEIAPPIRSVSDQPRVRSGWRLGRWFVFARRADVERLYGDEEGSRVQASIREIARDLWPDGYQHLTTGFIRKEVGAVMKQRVLPVPSYDTFQRALGRRKN